MDRIQELEQINSELRARAEKAEEMCGILQKIIEHQNREGAVGKAVAITADGTVYTGSAMPGNRPCCNLGRVSVRTVRLDTDGQGDEASETIWHQVMIPVILEPGEV